MFKAEMIAPCGLDCNICSQALIEDDPYQGCNGPARTVADLFRFMTGIVRIAEAELRSKTR